MGAYHDWALNPSFQSCESDALPLSSPSVSSYLCYAFLHFYFADDSHLWGEASTFSDSVEFEFGSDFTVSDGGDTTTNDCEDKQGVGNQALTSDATARLSVSASQGKSTSQLSDMRKDLKSTIVRNPSPDLLTQLLNSPISISGSQNRFSSPTRVKTETPSREMVTQTSRDRMPNAATPKKQPNAQTTSQHTPKRRLKNQPANITTATEVKLEPFVSIPKAPQTVKEEPSLPMTQAKEGDCKTQKGEQ